MERENPWKSAAFRLDEIFFRVDAASLSIAHILAAAAEAAAAPPAGAVPPAAQPTREGAIDVTAGVIALRDWMTCLDAEGARAAATGRNARAQARGAFSACAAWEQTTRAAVTAAFGAPGAEDIVSRLRRDWPAQFAGRARGGLGQLAAGAWGACVQGAFASGNARRAGRGDDAIVEAAFTHCAQQERAFRATVAARDGDAAADSAVETIRAQLRSQAAASLRPASDAAPPK